MKIFRLLYLIPFSGLAAGCVMNSSEEQPITGAHSYYLSAAEVSDLSAKARGGDAAASLRLYWFYDFVKLDRNSALLWLKKSAQDGSPQGQYILGVFYLDFPEVKDPKKALHWLKKAAANGYTEAQAELDKLYNRMEN